MAYPQYWSCPNCKAVVQNNTVCPNCGYTVRGKKAERKETAITDIDYSEVINYSLKQITRNPKVIIINTIIMFPLILLSLINAPGVLLGMLDLYIFTQGNLSFMSSLLMIQIYIILVFLIAVIIMQGISLSVFSNYENEGLKSALIKSFKKIYLIIPLSFLLFLSSLLIIPGLIIAYTIPAVSTGGSVKDGINAGRRNLKQSLIFGLLFTGISLGFYFIPLIGIYVSPLLMSLAFSLSFSKAYNLSTEAFEEE